MECQQKFFKEWVDEAGRRLRSVRARSKTVAYRFVTLWVSAFRTDMLSLLTSAIVGASGAEFCVSSIKKSMFVVRLLPLMAALGDMRMPEVGCKTKDDVENE